MRSFYEQGKYRWEMLDKYGSGINKEDLRDIKISQVFGSGVELDMCFMIHLHKTDEDGWGQYMALYRLKEKKLSIYPAGDEVNVRVKFLAQDIEQCEEYVDLVCKGNSMELSPINIKS